MVLISRLPRPAAIAALVLALLAGPALAQNKPAPTPAPINPALTLEQDATVDRLAQQMLDEAAGVIANLPPALPEPAERRLAMHLIDGVLREPNAAARPAVQEFFKSRMDGALNEIENMRPEKGVYIWKLYNQGYVVRTPTVTLGFDLVRGHCSGSGAFAVFDDVLVRTAAECDALFVSNARPSHADDKVVEAFVSQKKPVIAPPSVFPDKPFAAGISRLERNAAKTHAVATAKGELKVIVYPGRHRAQNVENNFVLVTTPEGWGFAFTGDQDFPDDEPWIAAREGKPRVDVLMPNGWAPALGKMIEGFAPRLVIPGHENELGHPLERRETYAANYQRLRLAKAPWVVMTWGERFDYLPD